MKKFKNRRFIGLAITLCIAFAPAVQAYNQSFADYVANLHLQSYPAIEKKAEKEFQPPQSIGEWLKALRTPRVLDLRKLDDRDKRKIAFEQMVQPVTSRENVVDRALVDKMQLVRGDTRATDHLVSRLTTAPNGKNLLKTTVGAKRLVEMISKQTTDIDALRRHQAIIRELTSNDSLRNKCNELLTKMNVVEPLVYDLFSRDEEIENPKVKVVKSLIGLTGAGLTTTTRLGEAFTFLPLILLAAELGTLATVKNPIARGIAQGALPGSIVTTLFLPISSAAVRLGAHIRLNMQEKLIGMATYLTALKQLIYDMGTNTEIRSAMPNLKTISQLLHHDQKASKEFNALNKLLSKSTFNREKPSALSSPGNIVDAYRKIIQEGIRKEYAPAMNLLG